MNSDAIQSKRILNRKQCLIASSNNSLKITKFSKIKPNLKEKKLIKAKSFSKQIKQKDYLSIKNIKIFYNPNARKRKTRLKIRKNKGISFKNINGHGINCGSIYKSKILKKKILEKKLQKNNSHLENLPVIK